jgi:hypothetical protein
MPAVAVSRAGAIAAVGQLGDVGGWQAVQVPGWCRHLVQPSGVDLGAALPGYPK